MGLVVASFAVRVMYEVGLFLYFFVLYSAMTLQSHGQWSIGTSRFFPSGRAQTWAYSSGYFGNTSVPPKIGIRSS